ncbi:Hypothetical protein R9X50_00135200 [Acrodontium crateriforme]|uniref:Uncharacterized protein n=1 Tax=Acrodontium crateriforme TaxID=150365 RepID=A0AAQ3R7U4_9PEZI|nr:Hypothetical protein R9X50_00135200 [Acrodontium crateriforme]
MGLPIWRNPDETRISPSKTAAKPDPTATARSSIRRRPAVHGRRGARNRLPRDATQHLTPLLERSPQPSSGFNGFREAALDAVSGVPGIETLFEAVDRRPRPAPRASSPDEHTIGQFITLDEQRRALRRRWLELRVQRGFTPSDDEDERGTEPTRTSYEVEPRAELVVDRDGHMHIRQYHEPSARPESHDELGTRRYLLPTPPLDTSEEPPTLSRTGSYHPLRRSWLAESLPDGLGDRNRSPTPTDGWEIIRTTITPDETLPSAESSFTSAAASQSFNSNIESIITEMERDSSSRNSRHGSRNRVSTDTVSTIDLDEHCFDSDASDWDNWTCNAMAEDVYLYEMGTREGRARIVSQQQIRAREGNSFANDRDPERIDIGLRLIEEALLTPAGRARLGRIPRRPPMAVYIQMSSVRRRAQMQRNAPNVSDYAPPSPHPERYQDSTRAAVRRAAERVHEYIRRSETPLAQESESATIAVGTTTTTNLDTDAETSHEGPQPHPVGPMTSENTTTRSRNANANMQSTSDRHEWSPFIASGDDEADLAAMRRVVERLAQRPGEEIPDEWWSSIGLNLSRPRQNAPHSQRRSDHSNPPQERRERDRSEPETTRGTLQRERISSRRPDQDREMTPEQLLASRARWGDARL